MEYDISSFNTIRQKLNLAAVEYANTQGINFSEKA
jgi:hypothetical protein